MHNLDLNCPNCDSSNTTDIERIEDIEGDQEIFIGSVFECDDCNVRFEMILPRFGYRKEIIV